ncbi:MAG: hypothetical protein ABJA66_09770 [Actinomycetota bacterium]
MARELFHGSEAHKLLFNIRNRGLTADSQGRLFFAERQWQNCLVHGADLQSGESYVGKFSVEIPPGAELAQTPTSGNPDARILKLAPGTVVGAEILELYVRRGKAGEFEIETIPKDRVQSYLENKVAENEALKQLAENQQKLYKLYELYSTEHQVQLNLSNESFAGFVTNAVFNSDKPQTAIWNNAYARLLAVKRHIKNKDVAKATVEMMLARLWYLYALNKYSIWKDGIEGAGKNMQIAIGVTAALLIVAAVGAFIATPAAAGASATGATSATASQQTISRIAASCAEAERVFRIADAATKEAQILEKIYEVERTSEPILRAVGR